MKIFREEYFGGLLYDDAHLGYQVVRDAATGRRGADRVVPLAGLVPRRDILSAPVRIYLELTRRCNLACRHCFAGCSPATTEGLGREALLELMDELVRVGVLNVRFTGGEPTAHPDWFAIVRHARDAGLIVALSSNGVYRDPRTLEQLLALRPEQVTFSLDGLEATHDALRGRGNFARTVAALEALQGKGLHLRLTTVLHRRNLHEIEGLVELASRHVAMINFVGLRPVGRGQLPELALDFEDHFATAELVRRLQGRYPDLVIVHSDLPLPEHLNVGQNSEVGGEAAIADAALYEDTSLCIAADGTIWPHHYAAYLSPRLRLGQVGDDLGEIWRSSPILDGFRAYQRALRTRCAGCPEYRARCHGAHFELELAVALGRIDHNPYCRHAAPAPSPWDYLGDAPAAPAARPRLPELEFTADRLETLVPRLAAERTTLFVVDPHNAPLPGPGMASLVVEDIYH